jgi:hypothetical protein
MASKLADLQDERLLDRISCASAIAAEPIKKVNITGGITLQKEVMTRQDSLG